MPQKFAPAPYKTCVQENTDYGGTDSGNELPCVEHHGRICEDWLKDGVTADNWEECAKKCHELPACRYWTFNHGTCYLKYYNNNKRYAAGVFSGTKDCVGPNY